MNILLAEDDSNIATIAILALTSVGGHNVEHVADGEAALAAALNGNYDLILLDEMMPKMSGHKVCETYTQKDGSNIPVIIMSANPQNPDLLKKIGAIGSIAKPFDPMELSTQINDTLKPQRKEAV